MPKATPEPATTPEPDQPAVLPRPCPCCGGRMIIIEVFERGGKPTWRSQEHRPKSKAPLLRIDTS